MVLEQRYRRRRLQNHQTITIEFLDCKIENSIEEEKKTPFHYIYTTSGERVSTFTSCLDEKILLLVHEDKTRLVKKLLKYREIELLKEKQAKYHTKNYRAEMEKAMAGFCQENLQKWKSNMQRIISKDNIEYNLQKNEEGRIKYGTKLIKAVPLSVSPKAIEMDYSKDSFENLSSSEEELATQDLSPKKNISRRHSIKKTYSPENTVAGKSIHSPSRRMTINQDKPFQGSSKDLVPDLNYRQIKRIAKKYKIPINQVYELITQYNGLVKISDQDVKASNEEDMVNSPRSDDEEAKKLLGVKAETLSKYTRLLSDKHPDLIPKILKGVGVDIGSKDPRVNLRSFLNLNSILDFGTANKSELIQFWTRILDPDNIMNVEKFQVMDFLEKLSKGRFTRSNNDEFSYAKDVWKFFISKEVVTPKGDKLDIHKLRASLEKGSIDIKIFGDIFKSGFNPSLNKDDDS